MLTPKLILKEIKSRGVNLSDVRTEIGCNAYQFGKIRKDGH